MTTEDENHVEYLGLLAANTKRLYAFIRILVLNDENEAEEVFQSTCIALWKKFDQYDPDGNFGAWACRMAHFEVLRLRDSRRRIKFLSEAALDSLAEAAMPISQQIDLRRSALSICVGKLNQKDVELVKARYFDARPVEKVARSLDRSVHAIYRDLKRVHATLKRCVERTINQEEV